MTIVRSNLENVFLLFFFSLIVRFHIPQESKSVQALSGDRNGKFSPKMADLLG